MGITKDEKNLLDEFKDRFEVDKISRKQIDKILKRNITDEEWNNYNKRYNKNYKSIFKQIAKQAANVGKKKYKK